MQLDIRPRRSKSISLTPLIDVVFILLLFFMLSTQFTQQQALTLQVPAANTVAAVEPNDNQLFIKLMPDGSVIINGVSTVSVDQLANNAQLQTAKQAQTSLIIDADDLTPLQALVSLTDTLSTLGFENVTLRALQ